MIATVPALLVASVVIACVAGLALALVDVAVFGDPGVRWVGRSLGDALLGLAGILIVEALCAALIVALVGMIRRDTRLSNHWRRRVRFARFAEANGGAHAFGAPVPRLTGTLVHEGATARTRDVFDFERAHGFQFGNIVLSPESITIRREGRAWGFIRVRLDRRVPHVVLESVRAGRTHPRRFGRAGYQAGQRIELEGDFGRYFTVYAPDGYGPDLLYVLTPDLMALLVDEAAGFDVELIDDSLLLSAPTAFRVGDRATLLAIEDLVSRVGGATRRRTERYADTRPGAVPRVVVAPGGRRLRRKWLLRATLPGALLVLLMVRHVLVDVLRLAG